MHRAQASEHVITLQQLGVAIRMLCAEDEGKAIGAAIFTRLTCPADP